MCAPLCICLRFGFFFGLVNSGFVGFVSFWEFSLGCGCARCTCAIVFLSGISGSSWVRFCGFWGCAFFLGGNVVGGGSVVLWLL